MLDYFVSRVDIKEIREIISLLNTLKARLVNNEFLCPHKEYDASKFLFERVRSIAIETNDEKLANAQFVFDRYFQLFVNLTTFFGMLKEEKYRRSWDKLQDCNDIARTIGRLIDLEKRWEIPSIVNLLLQYEGLYPYMFFISPEVVIEKSHCSICGRSMRDFDCSHRIGMLYWGKLCYEVFDKVNKIPSLSLVEHPRDKRCVIEMIGNEPVRFGRLQNYLQLGLPYLMRTNIVKDKVYPIEVLKLKYIVIKQP